MRQSVLRWTYRLGLLAVSLLAEPAWPHDLPGPDELPLYSRYASTRAYFRGGRADHEGFEAERARIPGAADDAVVLGRDLDGDHDPDEIEIKLEVIEVQEEVFPGKLVNFWVFAPIGRAMSSPARLPSPTIRVEEGDRVKVTLYNTHYLPHTIHFHGMSQDWTMDGVPDMPRPAIGPGERFTYEFVAKVPGTYYYHCHVHPHVHVQMGLAGMVVVEPNRPHNHFAHLVPGAGRIAPMAKGTAEQYEGEYSLIYMDIDERLHRIPAVHSDPREIEWRMHRDYDPAQRRSNIFMLNGRSFPYTLRDTPILVKPGETTRLRVLNVGERLLSLHTHGHHPVLTEVDGAPLPPGLQVTRDTFAVAPAQRADLALKTGDDPRHAAGPGVWLMHDHTESTQVNNGIHPGGDKTAIVYDGFMGEDGMPAGMAGHAHHHDAAYYRGERPVFDPRIFGSGARDYGRPAAAASSPGYPSRVVLPELPRMEQLDAERHRVVASACPERPRSVREIVIRGGSAFAGEGEVYGFAPREIHVERCEEVRVTLENTDGVRHDLMLPGLSPMFAMNFVGPGAQTASFVTPDADITLLFHCHVPMHEQRGMIGRLVVGKGGEAPTRLAQAAEESAPPQIHRGVGTVITTVPRLRRLIVNHDEIKGFMGAMEMSYPVRAPSLLDGLAPGDRIGFTIDAGAQEITAVEVLEKGR